MVRDPAEVLVEAMHEAWRAGGAGTIAVAMEKLSQRTGQNTFRHTANIIRGTKLGRTAKDDQAALWMIGNYPLSQRCHAVRDVAKKVRRTGEKLKTVERRLRLKLRAKEKAAVLVLAVKSIA